MRNPSRSQALSRTTNPHGRGGYCPAARDVEVRLGLRGAKTSTHIRPDQGHVHLVVDGKLVDMNYGLNERLPTLSPGQHVIQAEFVAVDHTPFEPRVLAQAAFNVTP